MTRLGVTKDRLISLNKVVTELLDCLDDTYQLTESELSTNSEFKKKFVVRTRQAHEFLKEGNSGLGSIVKPSHRKIATSVDLIQKSINEMMEMYTAGSALTDDKIHNVFKDVLLNNGVMQNKIQDIDAYLQFALYRISLDGRGCLREIRSIGINIKDEINSETNKILRKNK